MENLQEFGVAARLLGRDALVARTRMDVYTAAETASRTICRLDYAVGQLASPRPWLRLEELVGLAAAGRAAGEDVELLELMRDRLGLRSATDMTLGEMARELTRRWSSEPSNQISGREAVVTEVLRADASTGEPPASLIGVALRLDAIARGASWQVMPGRQVAIDAASRSVTISSSGETSTIGDYVLMQPPVFERIGITARQLPSVVASPALLISAGDEALARLVGWLQALASAAEAAHHRLARYRRFEQRVEAVLSGADARRRSALERVLALFSEHWMLWPRRAASLADMPHNTAWRAMNDAEHEKLIFRLPGHYPGGAGMYVLAPVAEAAGIRAIAVDEPLPSPSQRELRLESVRELDAAEAGIDRLIGSDRDTPPSFFTLDDVEL